MYGYSSDYVRAFEVVTVAAIHADPVDPVTVHEASELLVGLPAEAVPALLAVAGR